jgi:putative transposon-encoded protein
MVRPMKLELEAYQVVEKIVKPGGNSGRVYVPIEWMGKKVKIVLIEPLE